MLHLSYMRKVQSFVKSIQMADAVLSDVCHSQFLSNSESTNEVNTCLRCRNYEVLLKESLGELNS